jgi:hypothetical protein
MHEMFRQKHQKHEKYQKHSAGWASVVVVSPRSLGIGPSACRIPPDRKRGQGTRAEEAIIGMGKRGKIATREAVLQVGQGSYRPILHIPSKRRRDSQDRQMRVDITGCSGMRE